MGRMPEGGGGLRPVSPKQQVTPGYLFDTLYGFCWSDVLGKRRETCDSRLPAFRTAAAASCVAATAMSTSAHGHRDQQSGSVGRHGSAYAGASSELAPSVTAGSSLRSSTTSSLCSRGASPAIQPTCRASAAIIMTSRRGKSTAADYTASEYGHGPAGFDRFLRHAGADTRVRLPHGPRQAAHATGRSSLQSCQRGVRFPGAVLRVEGPASRSPRPTPSTPVRLHGGAAACKVVVADTRGSTPWAGTRW